MVSLSYSSTILAPPLVLCHLKYLYLCLGLHNHAEGRHPNLASQYGPFASVVGFVDERRAGEVFGL